MTPGVEMQLCASQALKKYEYKEETLFYKQLFSSVILEECHGEISVSEPETEAVKAKPERQKIRKEKICEKGQREEDSICGSAVNRRAGCWENGLPKSEYRGISRSGT